jgi:hypothetical protein
MSTSMPTGFADFDLLPEVEADLMIQDLTRTGDVDTDSDTIEEDAGNPAGSSGGERPRSRTPALYSGLKKLVASAKGVASKPVIKFINK